MIKKIIAVLVCAAISSGAWAAYTTKIVCHDVKNTKTGKLVKQCKTIKVHKKYNGTKVPATTPKKTTKK
jgi:hypothetical protein